MQSFEKLLWKQKNKETTMMAWFELPPFSLKG
jgi:hypothetical protein